MGSPSKLEDVYSSTMENNATSDDLFFEMWDRENRWIEGPKQKTTSNPGNRPIEQWSRSDRLVATHKTVKSITSFKPVQDAITKCCDDGGGEVLLDCKPFRFCYKEMVTDDDVQRKTNQKRNQEASKTSDIPSELPPAPAVLENLSGLSATDNIFSMLFP